MPSPFTTLVMDSNPKLVVTVGSAAEVARSTVAAYLLAGD